jgi:hypothetical protein
MLTPFVHFITDMQVREYSPGWFEIAGNCAGHVWSMNVIWQTRAEAEEALREIKMALPANKSMIEP